MLKNGTEQTLPRKMISYRLFRKREEYKISNAKSISEHLKTRQFCLNYSIFRRLEQDYDSESRNKFDPSLEYLLDMVHQSSMASKVSYKLSCKIKNSSLQRLIFSFAKLKGLQTIKLDFSKSWQIKDQHLQYLSRCFKMLGSSGEISLNFRGCCKITPRGIYCLIQGLRRNSQLKSINLDFSLEIPSLHTQGMINDKVLSKLGQLFGESHSLEIFQMSMDKCKDITDLGLNEFGKNFSRLRLLQSLTLHFKE